MFREHENLDSIRFKELHDKLDLILSQTTQHNGRMTKVERILLIVGTVVLVLLIVNGSKFTEFISSVI